MPTSERVKGRQSRQDMTLLLLLVLTAGLAGQVHSDYDTTGEESIPDQDALLSDVIPTEETAFTTFLHSAGDEGGLTTEEIGLSGEGEDFIGRNNPIVFTGGATDPPPISKSSLDPLVIIIPVVLLLLLVVAMSVAVFILSRRRVKKHSATGDMREDEILHGYESDKIPMPMFEDDVPSVLELEMEDLEKWMIKDTGRICVDSAGGEA